MSIESRIIEELINLIPVLAGALIALFGAGIKYLVDTRDRRKQICREKLENLMALVYQLKLWTSTVDDRYIFGRSRENISLPTDEITVIGRLYFPNLDNEISNVVYAARKYQKMAMEAGEYRLANEGKLPENYMENLSPQYGELLNTIETLTKEAQSISKRLL
ncbi:MAG: hypothetical protein R3355_00690 [Pseudomonas sp.]|uniref:hypothetical protein n=1 Tax=Pseudomonas sp. TaxID=306 RepID=UPI00299E4CFE|nr:hypothetical protein [Pseudomonas sp.]MDX1721605.1 hypothetical protein [Pseudomonas sp.]